MMKTVFPNDFCKLPVKLGEQFIYKFNRTHTCVVKFIKVTPKGFNFLNVETNKCILKRHVYDPNWSRKKIPENIENFNVWIKIENERRLIKIWQENEY